MKPRVDETPYQALRHHLMHGVIERVARTSQDFVLRGGYLTRAWVDPLPRPTEDLDFVGDFAFSVEDTIARFAPALACKLDDKICIDATKLAARGIWVDTQFPGVHLDVAIGIERADQRLGIDIGFRDPLVPPAIVWANGMRVVRAETQLAWKLHGLVEMAEQWRPKDLADAWLIATRVELDVAALPLAIEAAFTSRGFTIDQACGVLDDDRWTTKSARVRWASHTMRPPGGLVLADVLSALRERLRPTFTVLEEKR